MVRGQHEGEALLVDDDEFRSVLREVLVVGDDHGQRLSCVPCAVDREDRLRGLLESLVAGDAADLAGGEVLAGEHRVHTWRGKGGVHLDAEKLCVRLGRSHELRGDRPRNPEVSDESAVAAQQPVILPAGHRDSDEARRPITRHRRLPGC